MAEVSWAGVQGGKGGVSIMLLVWISIAVPQALLQPPLSLPVHMSVVPPPWHFLPLSQVELGPLFSNSSPFSFSQSFLMVAPPGQAPRPGLQASFGPYSVTQHISEPVLPLSAFLLSEHVERVSDKGRQEGFRVRTLFHRQSDTRARGTCITLHAFKDTEEHKATCLPQPPLGLCTVTLTLPSGWFEDQHTNLSHKHQRRRPSDMRPRRRGQHRERQWRRHHLRQRTTSHPLKYQRVGMTTHIHLYYSSSDTVADLRLTPGQVPGCVEDRAESQRQLFHIKTVTLKEEEEEREQTSTKEEETCLNGKEEEELSLDPHVMIRYHKGPVLIGQPIRVSVNLRTNFSSEFAVIRLKIKKGLVSMVAQRTPTSDLLAVTLERSRDSKHDIVSIFCHKHSTVKHTHDPTLLQQVVCLSVEGLRQSFGVAMTVSAHWWVEYSRRIHSLSPHGAAVSIFSFADRHIFSIAPITESNTIINTAILTNQPVSLPVIVLAIHLDGKVSDVTSAVTCHSTNENTVKVSSDCSTLFVDGSESGLGDTCAEVEFLLGALRGTLCLEVWAPSVPLRVSLADSILNVIDGWKHFTEEG
ncbi:hypothetical protein KUCAC02_015780 [Chaenocephalus aceratus]|uniref:Uncharacterized protein n=1 Tax=Chaenocephalus aceratus TaxID=36190 RepID=A0ACB9XYC8_CHAAC|nr:hypothetical protein KUCAC02_015780 [Chaenocephalus aceratus]